MALEEFLQAGFGGKGRKYEDHATEVKKREKGAAQRDSNETGKAKGEHAWWRELGQDGYIPVFTMPYLWALKAPSKYM